MKSKIFYTEQIQAILNNNKIMFREVIKPHNPFKANFCGYKQGDGLWIDDKYIKDYSVGCCWIKKERYIEKYAPYQVGDILYVRETWSEVETCNGRPFLIYKADDDGKHSDDNHKFKGWRPSIHMPKEAARIFLEVTNVRVERLQDITLDDMLLEGIGIHPEAFNDPENAYQQGKEAFKDIWIEIYGIDSWQNNDWVWVYEFKRIDKP